MNNAQMSARVGLFFLLGVALVWVTFESLNNGKLNRNKGYTLVAHFTNLKELKAGDEVRMAGVRIGNVGETRLDGHLAAAVLIIDAKIHVTKDATATIAMAGLLGADYISLDIGNDATGFLADGDEVKSADTPDLNTLVSELGEAGKKVESALSQFTGTGNDTLFGKIDKLVDTNGPKLTESIANLRDISDKINKGEGTLGKLVNDTDLHDQLISSFGEIKDAAAQAKTFIINAQGIVDQVKTGKGALGTLVYDEQAGENIKISAKNLRELSDKLNHGQGTLGKLINDDSLFNDAKSTLHKVDRAADGLNDSGPISAVGTLANSLF